MKVTLAIKRCRGCVFWDRFNGNIANNVMRKIHGVAVPARKTRACQLVLRPKHEEDGSITMTPVYPHRAAVSTDILGPRFGRRCGPKDVCEHHTPKEPPYVRPGPTIHVGATHLFEPLPELAPTRHSGDLRPIPVAM